MLLNITVYVILSLFPVIGANKEDGAGFLLSQEVHKRVVSNEKFSISGCTV